MFLEQNLLFKNVFNLLILFERQSCKGMGTGSEETESERKRERDFHSLVHSSDGLNDQG